ncbi:helix-turn-helix domain-containing protein [Rhodanobacter sp. MP1X3]|uniref:helix-turn-helix domain-containing protein n=1 Tax=Rhodanobacter sp. MP1X3 TaxID=2723086 RepID=UPI001610189F|nr:helix-turn-helix domain-containing protein [Rhodanobacter sp. MP1X3]MBB6244823.1 transcriptional regulator with XRE-family HTH domain [Rhodanobacter sp. MP1X3]
MGLKEEQGARLALIRGSESQASFAPKIRIHKNTLGNWERGEREIGAEALKHLADLGWSPLWVLTGLGEEKLDPALNPSSAADIARVIAHDDRDADGRRTKAFGSRPNLRDEPSQPASQDASQPVRHDVLMMAVRLATEALGEKVLPPAKHAELVTMLYELLDEGLPEAKVLRFARTAAA